MSGLYISCCPGVERNVNTASSAHDLSLREFSTKNDVRPRGPSGIRTQAGGVPRSPSSRTMTSSMKRMTPGTPEKPMIRRFRTPSVTLLLNNHPLEACFLLRSLTQNAHKTRVVWSALIARFGKDPGSPLHRHSSQFIQTLRDKSPLSDVWNRRSLDAHTPLRGFGKWACRLIHLY